MRRERLTQARTALGLARHQAADAIGISEIYLRKLEAGGAKPGRETMVRIEQFYNISMRELFPDIFLPVFDNQIINKEV